MNTTPVLERHVVVFRQRWFSGIQHVIVIPSLSLRIEEDEIVDDDLRRELVLAFAVLPFPCPQPTFDVDPLSLVQVLGQDFCSLPVRYASVVLCILEHIAFLVLEFPVGCDSEIHDRGSAAFDGLDLQIVRSPSDNHHFVQIHDLDTLSCKRRRWQSSKKRIVTSLSSSLPG